MTGTRALWGQPPAALDDLGPEAREYFRHVHETLFGQGVGAIGNITANNMAIAGRETTTGAGRAPLIAADPTTGALEARAGASLSELESDGDGILIGLDGNVLVATMAQASALIDHDQTTGFEPLEHVPLDDTATDTNHVWSASKIAAAIAAASTGGTVTSVQVAGGTTGLTFSGGPITSSGTITMAGTLAVANGGTGATDAATARANLGAGDVVGPASSTDNALARFDGTTGKLLQNSAVVLDDAGDITAHNIYPAANNTYDLGVGNAWRSIYVNRIATLTSNGFVTVGSGNGTLSVDTASYQPLDSDLTSWAGVTRAAGFDTFATTPSSANLAALLSDETGTGAAVFATSPTLVTPNIGAATGTSLFLGGTPASGVLAYVNSDANTATASALLPLAQVRNILNPASSSASVDYCYYATLRSDSSCAQDFTAARAAYRSACEHLGSGTMEGLQGAHFWASSGPNSGSSSGSGIVNKVYGVLADAYVNGTSSGTTGIVAAAQFSGRNRSPGTVTTLFGNNISVGSENGGSGAGTIAQAYGLRVGGLDITGTDILTAGTITNGTMLEVGDWSSGPTYTNPPIGLNIASQTASNAIALKTGTGKIDLGDKITTYNAIATVGNGVPSIVAQASGTAQSAAVGTTTLYTPPADGFYRLSGYLQLTQAATSSSTLGACTIGYTDGYGSVAQTNTMGFFNGSGGVVTSGSGNTTGVKLMGSMVIYAKSGVAITFAIAYASSGATAMQYAYNFKLEAL